MLNKKWTDLFLFVILNFYSVFQIPVWAQTKADTLYRQAWAGNSINSVIFRKNSITSNKYFQYTSFYDVDGYVVVGRKNLNSGEWAWKKLNYRGNILDAHNTISIQLDGLGYLHVAWDHHNQPLHYFRNIAPGSLEFEPMQSMIGRDESAVSYPEFYKLPDGNLIFLYRNGSSGNGNLVLNRYEVSTATWQRLHDNLLDGEGRRNAYWQATVDRRGNFHMSWTWRETPDVSSNHDICYAVSNDQGMSWKKSDGVAYHLPIQAENAEYIQRIPQNSELINQTSMTCDDAGQPVIATYWRDSLDQVPQYHVLFRNRKKWINQSLKFRNSDFSLKGMGTRSIPVSRPQIIAWNLQNQTHLGLIFRDEERGNKDAIAIQNGSKTSPWKIIDLYDQPLDRWEPTYDADLWSSSQILNLFIQQVDQGDGEQVESARARPILILEWKPKA